MRKLTFFFQFYKTRKMRFLALVLIFAFAAAILSCSLFVYRNNDVYASTRIQVWGQEGKLAGGGAQEAAETYHMADEAENSEYSMVFDTMEKVMTVFSLGSILIVVWGCTSILFFQNVSMQKSHAMLRIFGMSKKDIFAKAWAEGLAFGLPGCLIGGAGGYVLFRHLSEKQREEDYG